MKYNHSRFMRNYWKARLCHGCECLHVGRDVDHNHCDLKPFSRLRDRRVWGHNESCDYKKLKKKEEKKGYEPDSQVEPPFGIRRDGYGKGGHRHG